MLDKSSKEELQRQFQAEVKKEWTLEDLQKLEGLLIEPSFSKWLRWQARLAEVINNRIWKADSWEQYKFIQGQHDVLIRFDPERMKEEIKQLKETLKNDFEAQTD